MFGAFLIFIKSFICHFFIYFIWNIWLIYLILQKFKKINERRKIVCDNQKITKNNKEIFKEEGKQKRERA
uniref:Uncharacterized protein n=1 Tax=Meloidogyne enterolobii TaxID=390850 RepID=A0A6V7Y5B9_MELEN|nr:unnamed protein product [Meloidogyne enterolobii]